MSKTRDSVLGHSFWYHILFWVAYLVLFIAASADELSLKGATISVFFIGVGYAVFVYVNLLVLFPNFLAKGKYLQYMLFFAIIALLGAIPLALIWRYFFASSMETDMSMQQYFLFSAFNIAFMMILTTVLKVMKKYVRDQQNESELKNEQLRTELDFLRSQVNPHFLFNTLNNLYSLTLNKSDKAPEIVLKLSAILRYMLYDCNERKVFLNNEITFLQNYIELESLRQGGSASIELHVDGNTDRKMIAPLLFTPLLENSIKHGLNNADGSGWVKMLLKVVKDDLIFEIENSKSPVPATSLSKASGIGLVNIRRRLELIYPDRNTFKITDTPQSYKVMLNLTLFD